MTDREEYMEAHNDDGRHDDDEPICPDCGDMLEDDGDGWACTNDDCSYYFEPNWRKNIG